MAFNIGLAPNIVKTAIDRVFFTKFDYENYPGIGSAEDPLLFVQDTTDRNAVITEQFQGVGYFDTRAEQQDVSSGTVRVGNQKTSKVVNYAKSIDISKNLFDDDQHGVVQKMIQDFSRLAKMTRDKNAFAVYNLGFTTQQSNDNISLFNDAHITLNGISVDNKELGSLTPTNMETAMISLQQQLTQDGTLGAHLPRCLLVPTALFKEAIEITKSELRPGTANNDLNYYSMIYPGLEVRYSPFLSVAQGGSDTAWFLLSANHYIVRWVRQPIQTVLVPWDYQRNNNYIFKAEYREVIDSLSFEGIVGSTGTA